MIQTQKNWRGVMMTDPNITPFKVLFGVAENIKTLGITPHEKKIKHITLNVATARSPNNLSFKCVYDACLSQRNLMHRQCKQ